MKRAGCIVLLLLFWGCKEGGNGIEKGVSRELAVARKSMIGSVNYDLYFTIPENKEEAITAESTISFEWSGEGKSLILDFKAEKRQLLSITSEGKRVSYSFKNEHIVIPEKHVKEGANSFTIKFIAGDISLNRNDDFLYTLLVPDRCRTLMPCFDQPDIKARFKLKLKIPAGWKAVSNGEPLRGEPLGDYRLCEFGQTKPLSTYLFAFTVGRFEYNRYYNWGRWIGVYHRETDTAKINHSIPAIVEQVRYSLDWMEHYTGIRYPFDRYNVVAIPDFQYGGMEHPGATYYRSSSIFLSPDADQAAQMRRSELIAHETAHMWFGDLVTMKWFDDVWLKEVFAGLMADKIVAGLYRGIDHRLNFFLNHYEPSLRVDRTLGCHSILQDLPNLKDAGTLYGDIIYHKAPIVMRILERRVSDEGLRRGLTQYLLKWQYSNADWNDLLQMLQATTRQDLQDWNDIWLKERGAPVVRFKEEGITMTDEWEKGKVWPQSILLSRIGDARAYHVELKDTLTPLPFPSDEVVLPDSDMRGYACFLPTEKGIRFLNENLSLMPNALHRAMGWQSLYTGVLYKKMKGESFVRACLKHLPAEKNNLIINRTLSFLTTVYTTYLDEGARQLLQDEVERFFIGILFKNEPLIDKKPYFRTLLSIYTSTETGDYFYKMLIGATQRGDLKLTEDDKLTIAYNMVLRNPDQYDYMKRYITREVKNPDLRKRFEYVYPALSGNKVIRDSVFNALLEPENRGNEVWTTEALRWLNHPKRKMEAEEYVARILAEVQEIQATGDIFFPTDWLRAGLSGHTSKYVYTTVSQFFEKHPNYPENLKLKILSQTDHLRRIHME